MNTKKLIHEQISLNSKTNNYEMNFDKWIAGENKILWITGLMGSGKSVLGKKLAEEYKCEKIELDDLINWFNQTILQKYLTQHGLAKISDTEYFLVFNDYFQINLNHFSKGKQIIVEGVHIMYPEFFNIVKIAKTDSIIILNTSFLKATFRSLQRDGLMQLFNNISNNIDFTVRKNKLLKFIKK